MLIRTALSFVSPAGRRGRLLILIFHRVLPKPDPLFPGEVDVATFDMKMAWIRSWLNVLPLDEALIRLKQGSLPSRAATITFDDGYADNLLYAMPILKKYDLPASFFVVTGYMNGGRMWSDTLIESIRHTHFDSIDCSFLKLGELDLSSLEAKREAIKRLLSAVKYLPYQERADQIQCIAETCAASLPSDLMLTSAQLKALHQSGMGIGAHTVTHPILARMDDNDAMNEIAQSKAFIEDVLKERISFFAYPNGKTGIDYLPKHVDMVKKAGFSAALTTNWGACRYSSDIFQLPRFTPWEQIRKAFGVRLLRSFYY